jgi:cell division septal protein FtsQ
MWFKRKPENRRLEREHVLDVKLRTSQVKAVRNRWVAVVLGTAFCLVLGSYLAWSVGEWALRGLVYENKAFALRELDVRTDGVLAVDQIKRWAGVRLDDNLLALDLARVKRYLELNPAIESVSIERILPRTLRIRVVEREPIAQINIPRPGPDGGLDLGVFQIDAQGYVMLPLAPYQRSAQPPPGGELYPLLDGLDPTEVRPGRRIDLPPVQAALRLIDAFEHSPMEGLVDLKRIDVSSPEVLVVTTGQGSEVTFGLADTERQMLRWREIYDCAQKLNRAIATLDLAITNNIPARWLEVGAATPPPAKPARSPHIRKKHV